jgi:quercetin dioxygenase-like cupin family protein
MSSSESRKSVVVPPGEGHAVWSTGARLDFKVRAEHTGGDFVLTENVVLPGGGPPPHVHAHEDEMFYILQGELTLIREDTTFAAGPGTAVFLPRGKVHTFANRSNAPTRFLTWASSSNFESFMLEFSVPCADHPTPPPFDASMVDRLLKACDRYGMQIRFDHKPSVFLSLPPVPKSMKVLGQNVTLKLIGRNTNERMCAALVDVLPGPGVLPHLHRREDETFYVIDGTLEFLIDGVRHIAPKGTTVYVPRGTFHGFHAVGGKPAQVLSMHTPAGFEHFFTEMGGMTVRGIEPSEPAAVVKLLQKHGMEVPV